MKSSTMEFPIFYIIMTVIVFIICLLSSPTKKKDDEHIDYIIIIGGSFIFGLFWWLWIIGFIVKWLSGGKGVVSNRTTV